jgi:hypothetical protein
MEVLTNFLLSACQLKQLSFSFQLLSLYTWNQIGLWFIPNLAAWLTMANQVPLGQ